MKYYLGLDVGSTACKVVIINERFDIIKKVCLPVNVDPFSTIAKVLSEIECTKYKFDSIGVTGSARNLIAKYLKTNFLRSEIIAHSYATLSILPNVRSIIEIGGQDSKFIEIQKGIVSKFKMNSVCAAGTGSFLQWQAERMGITLKQFDELACKADRILEINGKCSVFIESSIIALQRRGEKRENIAYSICICLANNYINELCKADNMIEPIVFQGGVARLESMKNAFSYVLKKDIIINKNCEYMGAIGVAQLASREKNFNKEEVFLDKSIMAQYKKTQIKCTFCERNCNLTKYYSDLTKDSFIIGGMCGRY